MTVFQTYAKELIRLHELLNEKNCPSDIDEQYKQFYFKNDDIISKSYATIRSFSDLSNGKEISLHDSCMENFSEKKFNNKLNIKFKIVSIIYEEKNEVGYVPIEFQLTTQDKLRDFSKNTIFEFLIDSDEKNILLIGITPNGKHEVKEFNYSEIQLSYGKPYLYNEEKPARCKI